jgi:peptidoglycan/LPS O-acetylase OafA/YrhL
VALLAFCFCGACLYLYRSRIPMRWPGLFVACAVLGVSLVTGIAPLGAIAISYIVIFLGTRRFASARRLTRLGDPSYGAYLYAYPVQQALYQLGVRNVAEMFVLATVISFGLGYASWHLVERPALRFARRFTSRRSTAPLAEPAPLPEPALATD